MPSRNRTDKHVLDGKTHGSGELRILVPHGLHLFEKPKVAVVFVIRGPLRQVRHHSEISTLIRRHLSRNNIRVRQIPTRRVVHPRFPPVIERDTAVAVEIAGLRQPPVPPNQIAPAPVEELFRDRTRRTSVPTRMIENPLHRDRVNGGWVIPDVAVPKGACAANALTSHRVGPGK